MEPTDTATDTVIGVIELLFATGLLAVVIWALTRARAAVSARLREAASRRLEKSAIGQALVRSPRIIRALEQGVTVGVWALGIFLAYWWLTFGLRRFAYTRPWGDPLRAFFFGRVTGAAQAAVLALPGLFTVLLVVVATQFATRLVQMVFQAVSEERIKVPWLFAETAEPTRKLVTVALWLFAVAVAYPYLPGAGSDSFKGVSVFAGLVISLGSSGLVNQMMSGLTLTYSRALRQGDYVAVSGVEGTVTELGTLSTKIRTPLAEDVTIPNAVMISTVVTNYSRLSATEGVFVPTSVTIGYDTPWRQVQALLLLAAARTPGIRRDPAPMVWQASLDDPYVKYTLLFCLEEPTGRVPTLAAVHANILDAFNEFGVQIMSPRYLADPAAPKVVPKDQWYAAPASAVPRPGAETTSGSGQSPPGGRSR